MPIPPSPETIAAWCERGDPTRRRFCRDQWGCRRHGAADLEDRLHFRQGCANHHDAGIRSVCPQRCCLTFDFGKAAAGKPVELHFYYFTPGFKWIPTYRITGNLKDQADVALQGEIVNDLEDITGVNVDLVVGVPKLRFKDVVSPLVLEPVLRNAVGNARGLDNNGNFLNSQFGFNNSYSGRTTVVNPELPAEILAGSGGEQDLFIYPLENFSLSKDGRASAALWQSTVPVRNVYTYEVKGPPKCRVRWPGLWEPQRGQQSQRPQSHCFQSDMASA